MAVEFDPKRYEDPFIAELVQFVAADEFQTLFEQFFLTFAIEFTDEEEHKLRYTEIYQNFHGLFEEQLETFCHSKGYTNAEFMRRCSEASTEDQKARHYIDILLASCEYNTFVRLMRIMRPVAMQRLARKAEAKTSAPASTPPGFKADEDQKSSAKLEDDLRDLDLADAAPSSPNADSKLGENRNEYSSSAKDVSESYDSKSAEKDYGEK